MNFRRILAIFLFILVTIGIGYAIYRFFFAAPPGAVVPPQNANVNGGITGLPTSVNGAPVPVGVNGAPLPPPEVAVSPLAQGGITQVTPIPPVPTIGAPASPNGNLNCYNRNAGK